MKINTLLLNPEVQHFIKTHENDDVVKLIFKGSPFEGVNIQQLAQQIKGRQIAKKKFPKLYANDNIIYPPTLNLEQSSSEKTAEYKAQFIKPKDSLIDITGGFGSDTLAFADKSHHVIYCEKDSDVFEYSNHNLKVLKTHIDTQHTDGIEFIKENKRVYDWIYVDPSRRDKQKRKVFQMEDLSPNVLEHMELFRSKSKKCIIKLSPLLDLNLCIKKMPYITEVHIVALKNEVKDLLLILDFESQKPTPILNAVNLETKQEVLSARLDKVGGHQPLADPQTYLYEPNAAIMKSGLFSLLSRKYNVSALAKNTHLFTSDALIEFPGRSFKVKAVTLPKKVLLKQHIKSKKANISSRNFPLSPEQIKAKYGFKDGGDDYLFFVTDFRKQKKVLICKKI